MCIVTNKDFTKTLLVMVILLTFLSETIQKKEFLTIVLGSCLVSTVFCHVRSTQKEQINNHSGCHLSLSAVSSTYALARRWPGKGRSAPVALGGSLGCGVSEVLFVSLVRSGGYGWPPPSLKVSVGGVGRGRRSAAQFEGAA